MLIAKWYFGVGIGASLLVGALTMFGALLRRLRQNRMDVRFIALCYAAFGVVAFLIILFAEPWLWLAEHAR